MPRKSVGYISFLSAAIAACLLLLICDGKADAQRLFPGTYYSATPGFYAGYSLSDRAFADLDGDGILDVVTANDDSAGTVSVVFGRGDGGFRPAYPLVASAYAQSVAIGDFNGDGLPDIAVFSNYSYGTTIQRVISVFFNRGQGKFAPAVMQNVSDLYLYLAAGDLNHDGKADLVAVGYPQVTTLLSNGDGTFTMADTRTLSITGGGIALADADGDGKLDVLEWDGNYSSASRLNAVRIFPGTGDGTLGTERDIATLYLPTAVQCTDVNGDGRPDLVVGTTGDVEVLRNAGGNQYFSPDSYGQIGSVTALTILDLNGDSKPEIVAALYSSPATTQVLLNNGDGTYRKGTAYLASANSRGLAAGDTDGDGKTDLIMQTGNGLMTYKGDGRGAFNAPIAAPWYGIRSVADFNGDGKPDVLSIDTALRVYPGNGDGTFGAALVTTVGTTIKYSEIGDINGDGRPDVVVLSTDGGMVSLIVCTGDGSGKFTPQTPYVFPGATDALALGIGDFNGDGKNDLFLVTGVPYIGYTGYQYGLTASYSVLLGDGMGGFVAQPSQWIGNGIESYSVTVGDFNGDGRADIGTYVTAVDTSTLYTQLDSWFAATSKGDGTFTTIVSGGDTVFNSPSGYSFGYASFTFGDFDGDGHNDLVLSVFSPNSGSSLTILHSKRNLANFTIHGVGAEGPTGDFNGDGKTDLIVGQSGGFTLYYGNGDGTVTAADTYITPVNPAFAADLNGDGRLDLLGSGGVLLNTPANSVDVPGTVLLEGLVSNAPAQLLHFDLRNSSGNTVLTRTAYVGADGYVTLYGVPVGNYTVHIQGDRYLASNVTLNVTADGNALLNATLRAGDANGDNRVDIADFGVLTNAYGTTTADSFYDANADFNGDGSVDISDFGLLTNNFGLAGDN